MDFTKAGHVSGDFKDRKALLNWECMLFAEVIFIDKTHPSAKPLIYQLRDSALCNSPPPLIKSNAFSLSPDNFVLLGDVSIIDKKKKQIVLSNKNIVSYQYLVIASGSKPIYTEFAVGLQALVDALRVKPKIPTSFDQKKQSIFNFKKPRKTNIPLLETTSCEMGKIIFSQISSASKKNTFDLIALSKRFYEVQI